MASKFAHLLRRHPAVLLVLLVVLALLAARGNPPVVGLWDGPI